MTEYVRLPEKYDELLVPATDGGAAIASFLSQWGGSAGFISLRTYYNPDGTVGFLEVWLGGVQKNFSLTIPPDGYLVVKQAPEGSAVDLFVSHISLADHPGYTEV